jgi:glucokinase
VNRRKNKDTQKQSVMEPKRILSVDIGGSKLLTALADVSADGRVSFSGKVRRALGPGHGKSEILAAVEEAVDETLLQACGKGEFDGVGVTIPGLADSRTGTWLYAPFSGIRDFPIADELRRLYGKPVYAENDVNACAWAEYLFGACRGINDFLWITVSNGIGGGLVLGGKIFPGHFGCAAEVGHLKVVDGGALCGCGGHGCLEAEAAGPAIARRYAERTGTAPRPSALEVAEAARHGDVAAIEVYRQTGWLLGKGAALAANLLNPAAIIFGGGVAQSFDLFIEEIEKKFKSDIIMFANKDVQILKTQLGYEAGLFAAASLVYR